MKLSQNMLQQTVKYGFRSVFFCDFTLHGTVVCYWHFGSTHQSHLQGSSSPRRMPGTFGYTV